MLPIDRWAMEQLEVLITEVHRSYEEYAFHRVFSLIYNFCTVQMSSIYMDVLKDRMYCDSKESLSRRSGQTAMYHTCDAIIRLMAPILAHTAEEAWAAMSCKSQPVSSVHLAMTPRPMGIRPILKCGTKSCLSR
jgi:isoleucyl-tRNA synthetase